MCYVSNWTVLTIATLYVQLLNHYDKKYYGIIIGGGDCKAAAVGINNLPSYFNDSENVNFIIGDAKKTGPISICRWSSISRKRQQNINYNYYINTVQRC